MDNIEIKLSRTKITLLIAIGIGFVLIGVPLILNPEQHTTIRYRSPELLRIIGIITVSFFGICLIFAIRKLFDPKKGLIINNNGIIDNTSATSIGLIEWSDITGIATIKVSSTKIIMVYTDKPEKYIERAKNRIAKKVMKANSKLYGSPLSIVSTSLKIKHKQLENLLLNELGKRKK